MEIKIRSGIIKRVCVVFLMVFACLFLIQTMHYPLGVTLAEEKSFVFPEITGWKQSGEPQTFLPGTLYEYINGGADLYLAFDFQELKVIEYLDDKKATVTVEVYRHKSPTEAFGIYSQERLPGANYLNIGAQGYRDKNILNFLAGSCYVKINSYNAGADDQEVLQALAKKIEENLNERGGLPALLSFFPAEGKLKNSEKFIARNFLGYSFLHSAFTADYDLSGKKFKLFLIACKDRNECRNIIQEYLQKVKSVEEGAIEGRHTLSDPHHGIVDLYWEGIHVWGVLDSAEPDLRSRYLKFFEDELRKVK
jgi:Family of unknown function (DUF6599)